MLIRLTQSLLLERGYMLWRYDTKRILVLLKNRTWADFADRWDQVSPIPSRGNPPPGRQAPILGFDYLWGTNDWVWESLGWALEEEKGFCANIQPFERGFIFHSSTVEYCLDELRNWATHPSFVPLFFATYGDGTWRQY